VGRWLLQDNKRRREDRIDPEDHLNHKISRVLFQRKLLLQVLELSDSLNRKLLSLQDSMRKLQPHSLAHLLQLVRQPVNELPPQLARPPNQPNRSLLARVRCPFLMPLSGGSNSRRIGKA